MNLQPTFLECRKSACKSFFFFLKKKEKKWCLTLMEIEKYIWN